MPETITIITVRLKSRIRIGSTNVANKLDISRIGNTAWATESLLIFFIKSGASNSGGAPPTLAVKTRMDVTSRCSTGKGSWECVWPAWSWWS